MAAVGFALGGPLVLGAVVGGAMAYKKSAADGASLPSRLFATVLGGLAGGVVCSIGGLIGAFAGPVGIAAGITAGVGAAAFAGNKVANNVSAGVTQKTTASQSVAPKKSIQNPTRTPERDNDVTLPDHAPYTPQRNKMQQKKKTYQKSD